MSGYLSHKARKMVEESRTIKAKKKYGKVWEHNSVKRSILLDDDKIDETSKYLDGVKVVTPQELATRQGIRVSLAKKILDNYVEDGSLELVHSQGSNIIYKK